MSFVLHPEAEVELNEAVKYYEELEIGLGYDLRELGALIYLGIYDGDVDIVILGEE